MTGAKLLYQYRLEVTSNDKHTSLQCSISNCTVKCFGWQRYMFQLRMLKKQLQLKNVLSDRFKTVLLDWDEKG